MLVNSPQRLQEEREKVGRRLRCACVLVERQAESAASCLQAARNAGKYKGVSAEEMRQDGAGFSGGGGGYSGGGGGHFGGGGGYSGGGGGYSGGFSGGGGGGGGYSSQGFGSSSRVS